MSKWNKFDIKKIKDKFPIAQIQPAYESDNKWDTFGKSKTTDIIIALNSGNQIGVLDTVTLYCYQYSEGYKKFKLKKDNLGFKVSSKEFDKFIFLKLTINNLYENIWLHYIFWWKNVDGCWFNILNEHVEKFIVVDLCFHIVELKKLNFDVNDYQKFKDK